MRVLLLPLLISAHIHLWAQPPIIGRVVDMESQESLPGTHIHWLNHWEIGVVSHVDGSFTLPTHPGYESDSIYFSFVGYRDTLLSPLALRSSPKVPMHFKVVASHAVTVTAERLIAEDYSIEKINKMDIYLNPNAKADALLAVNSLPSATTVDESANVSFRGSSPAETGLFFNNVPVYDYVRFSQLNGIGTFSLFNTDMVQSVQVFPGNPPLEFGNTGSGLIAIETNQAPPEVSEYQLSASLASIGLSTRQKIGEGQGLHIYGNYQPSAIIQALNPGALEDIQHFESADLGIYYTNALGNNMSLKLFQYVLREGYEFGFRSPSFTGPLNQKRFRSLTIANVIKKIGPGRLSANAGFATSTADFGYSQFSFRPRGTDLYGSVNYHLELPRTGVKTGISWDSRRSIFTGRVPAIPYALDRHHPSSIQNERQNRTLTEAYLSGSHSLCEGLRLGLAVRNNLPNNNQKGFMSYQVNINSDLTKSLNLKLAYGRYHQVRLGVRNGEGDGALTTKQLSSDLQWSTSSQQSGLSLFLKRRNNIRQTENIWGLEFSHENPKGKKLHYSFSYTYLHARVHEGEYKKRGPFDMSYFLRAAISWEPATHWNLGARLLARQGVPHFDVANSRWDAELAVFEPLMSIDQSRLPAYQAMDINCSRILTINERMNAIFFANISNIFDNKNERAVIYNADYTSANFSYFGRRIFYFGVVIKWIDG